MKILYILHTTEAHGATISFVTMLAGLASDDMEFHIVVPNRNPQFENKIGHIHAEFYTAPISASIYPIRPTEKKKLLRYYATFIYRIAKLLFNKSKSLVSIAKIAKVVNPDIIHTNVGVIHEGYWCSKILHIPHVWHIREYQDLDFNWKIFPCKHVFIRELQRSYVVAISNQLLKYFNQGDNKNACVIYNGIFSIKDAVILHHKEDFFLLSSRIVPTKGHEDVIRAFATFHKKRPNFRLYILGAGDESFINKLKRMSVSLACDESIVWIGHVDNVQQYMKKAKALIVASRYEAFGRMTAEACFMGCMVIGRKTGGTEEIITQTGGILIRNVEDLIESMESVADMTDEAYSEIINHSQRVALNNFSQESNSLKIRLLYDTILYA